MRLPMKPLNIIRSAFAALALSLSAGVAHAQTTGPDGRWEGMIEIPNGPKLTGVFRVETKAGKTTAAFDSPEQGAKGIPATVDRDGIHVVFTVPVANITYEATLSEDGKSMVGQMSQGGGSISVTMVDKPDTHVAVTGPAVPKLNGSWDGSIATPMGDIGVVLRVSTKGDKSTTLLDVPVQSATGIECVTTMTGDAVTTMINAIGATFTGKLAADGKSVAGTWNQAGQDFNLTLTKK